MRRRAARAGLLALALALPQAAALAQNTNDMQLPSGGRSDWEIEQERRNPNEDEVRLPPYPKEGDLLEFSAGRRTPFRFFIDAASLSVGRDNIVRYAVVARSPSGVANVFYEGMRCGTGQYKTYAQGIDGKWEPRRDVDWRSVEPRNTEHWRGVLRWDFFCPKRGTILSAREGLDALRRGGHPDMMAKPAY